MPVRRALRSAFVAPIPARMSQPRHRRLHAPNATLSPRRPATPREPTTPATPPRPPPHPSPTALPPPIRLTPVYTAVHAQFSDIASTLTPSPYWRFILLSDGHIIQHLTSLTRGRVTLSLLSTAFSPTTHTVQRRIALLGPDGRPLLHATSTWHAPAYHAVMRGREHRPLWEVFAALRLEVSRAILAVHFGTCPQLDTYFAVPDGSGMWARDYVFRQQGVAFLNVHEVFSPRLARFLGPVVPPEGVSHLSTGQHAAHLSSEQGTEPLALE